GRNGEQKGELGGDEIRCGKQGDLAQFDKTAGNGQASHDRSEGRVSAPRSVASCPSRPMPGTMRPKLLRWLRRVKDRRFCTHPRRKMRYLSKLTGDRSKRTGIRWPGRVSRADPRRVRTPRHALGEERCWGTVGGTTARTRGGVARGASATFARMRCAVSM